VLIYTKAAGIDAPIGNHTFQATGITAYLANGGALEHAQEMAAHESPRTTKLYDRTRNGSPRTRWKGSGSEGFASCAMFISVPTKACQICVS
jgi:hypothetical protein